MLFYVIAGQGHIRDRELAFAARLMTASDAGMLSYAGQARAIFVTQCTLVIVKVRVTLGDYGESEKAYGGDKQSSLLWIGNCVRRRA